MSAESLQPVDQPVDWNKYQEFAGNIKDREQKATFLFILGLARFTHNHRQDETSWQVSVDITHDLVDKLNWWTYPDEGFREPIETFSGEGNPDTMAMMGRLSGDKFIGSDDIRIYFDHARTPRATYRLFANRHNFAGTEALWAEILEGIDFPFVIEDRANEENTFYYGNQAYVETVGLQERQTVLPEFKQS